MNPYSVYVHTCPNGKRYVGITSRSPEERWVKGTGYRNNIHFHRAIKKFGWDNIVHEVLYSNLSESKAIEIEKMLIDKYNTMNPKYGYNNTSGGEIGKEYSESIKLKMSENRRGIYCGEEHYCYGKTQEEIFGADGMRKTLEIAKERFSSDENPQKKNPRKGIDHPFFGKKFSAEVRQRMSDGKNTKISHEDSIEIIRLYRGELKEQKEIAEIYNISRQTVGDVIHGRIHTNATSEIRSRYSDRKVRERHDKRSKNPRLCESK